MSTNNIKMFSERINLTNKQSCNNVVSTKQLAKCTLQLPIYQLYNLSTAQLYQLNALPTVYFVNCATCRSRILDATWKYEYFIVYHLCILISVFAFHPKRNLTILYGRIGWSEAWLGTDNVKYTLLRSETYRTMLVFPQTASRMRQLLMKYHGFFKWKLNRGTAFPAGVHVRLSKIQINLRNCPVWSESAQGTLLVPKDSKILQATSEDSDQTAQMRSLIRVFAGRTCKLVGNAAPRLKLLILRFEMFCKLLLISSKIHSLFCT